MDFRGKKKEIFSLKKVFLWIFGAKKRRFWALSYEDLLFLSFNSKRGQFVEHAPTTTPILFDLDIYSLNI